ncbi:hypothetical protein FS837_001430 [Tulasnella sp. UAMH 9824]|nr:hypothetical protein FS837_001430 [Tulasnella sp. UAMH 9824]
MTDVYTIIQVAIVSTPLESRSTTKCRVPHARTTDLTAFSTRGGSEADTRIANATPNFLEKAHGLRSPCLLVEGPKNTARADPLKGAVDQPVVLKPAHRVVAWITLYSVEGFLSLDLCPTNSDRAGAVQWSITFHPRYHYYSTPNARVATDDHVFNILFHGISAFHPWAQHLSSVLVIPREMVTRSNEGADQTKATSTAPHSAAIPTQTIPNGELEKSVELAPSNGSSEACVIDEEEYSKPTTPVIPSLSSTSDHNASISEVTGLPLSSSRAESLDFERQPVEQGLATLTEQQGGRLGPSADVKLGSGENHVDAGDDQSGTSVAQEDVPAPSIKEENEPEKQTRKSKVHRGGKRTARMKQKQALREAAAEAAEAEEAPEAPEAGPSGPN